MTKRNISTYLSVASQPPLQKEVVHDNDKAGVAPCVTYAMYSSRSSPAHSSAEQSTESNAPRLSARELEVLSWLALGKSGGEVSEILGISVPTVRIHIRNIFRKLGACNIAHAIARAFLGGIFRSD